MNGKGNMHRMEIQTLGGDSAHRSYFERKRGVIALLGLGWFVFAVLLVALRGPGLHTQSSSGAELAQEVSPLTITVETEYSRTLGFPATDYPWVDAPIVEPYKDAYFSVSGATDDDKFIWTVIQDGVTVLTSEGSGYRTITFTDLGRCTILVKSLLGGDVGSMEVIVKYVRRNIKTLTDEDREKFFSAMYIAYTVETEEGQQTYGPDYLGAEWFTRYHNELAGDIYCDHFHDGLGFLNQHSSLTTKFEQTLQLIDPSVTVPYWDFTEEGEQVGDDMNLYKTSLLFSADWFGGVGGADGRIPDGRFKDLKIKADAAASGFSTTVNSYGFLRAPWNQNPSEYITRFPSSNGVMSVVPTCETHYQALQLTDWYSFGFDIQYLPHGTVHTVWGGAAGIDIVSLMESWSMSTTQAEYVAAHIIFTQKNMWRAAYLTCPESCTVGQEEPCVCTCPSLDQILADGNARDLLVTLSVDETILSDTAGNDVSEQMLRLYCNEFGSAPIIGEMLESAAPADPSFWPIHPTMERLYMWWRLQNPSMNITWVDDNSQTVHGILTGYCEGHNEFDVLDWTGLVEGDEGHLYTNRELTDLLEPFEDQLDYVYDNFVWSHCVQSGFDMGSQSDDTARR